jgi:predicted ferric reductase
LVLFAVMLACLQEALSMDKETLPSAQWSTPGGFTLANLVGLFVYQVSAPLALVAIAGAVLGASKMGYNHVACVTMIGSATVATGLGLFAYGAAKPFSCLYVFCPLSEEPGHPATNSHVQWQQWNGTTIFFTGWAVAAACGLGWRHSQLKCSAERMAQSFRAARRWNVFSRRVATVLLLIAVPAMCVICGLLPNIYYMMSPEIVRKMARSRYGRGQLTAAEKGPWSGPCVGYPGESAPPKVPSACGDAFMRTQDVELGDVIVHLWPDTLLFYGLLEILLIGGALSAELPSVARFFSRPVWKRLRVGDLAVMVLFVAFYVLNTLYWAHDHLYHQHGLGPDAKFNKFPIEVIARTLGQNAIATMGLLLLPATKSSMVMQVAGMSFEHSLWLHIILGVLMLLMAVGHIAAFALRFATQEGSSVASILPFNAWTRYAANGPANALYNNWTISMMNAVFWPSLLFFGVFPWMRRRNWELFKVSHHWFLVLVPASMIHANSGWYFVLPGAVLWVWDRALRFARDMESVDMVDAVAHTLESKSGVAEKVTELRFRWNGRVREHSPGMFAWINCPQVSAIEWHPFSLSASPLDDVASFHIKGMESVGAAGNGAKLPWTARLHQVVAGLESPSDLVVNIDGPHGPETDFGSERVLLVAGGIGITPMHNTLRFLLQQKQSHVGHVRLLFVAKSTKFFDIFQPTLAGLDKLGSSCEVELSLHCSAASSNEECALGPVQQGRPDFGRVLEEELSKGTTSVRFCGPAPMQEQLQKAVDALDGGSRQRCDWQAWSFCL